MRCTQQRSLSSHKVELCKALLKCTVNRSSIEYPSRKRPAFTGLSKYSHFELSGWENQNVYVQRGILISMKIIIDTCTIVIYDNTL